MMKAMSSAVAGLKAMQTGMDVIGNNISNVNTNGFKGSRTTYSDIYYQNLAAASASNTTITEGVVTAGNRGGTNYSQVGFGSTVSSVDVIQSRNSYDMTSSGTDLYINGEGYFALKDGSGYTYTRVGDFEFDGKGQLTKKGTGELVCGCNSDYKDDPTYAPKPSDTGLISDPVPIVVKDFNSYTGVKIGKDGVITGVKDGKVVTLGRVAIANIPNPSGLEQLGGSRYKSSSNSGTPTYYTAGQGATGTLITNALESSNVDIANEFANMITTQRGFQANSKIITVSDSMLEELCNMKR